MKKHFRIVALVLLFALTATGSVALIASRNHDAAAAVPAAVYKVGSTGYTVKTIQRKLKNWGYYSGSVDGIYGTQTKNAVKYFQRKNGLTADGIVGNATLKALGMSASTSSSVGSSTGGSYNSSDVYLLARIIHA